MENKKTFLAFSLFIAVVSFFFHGSCNVAAVEEGKVIYALSAPFTEITDQISSAELENVLAKREILFNPYPNSDAEWERQSNIIQIENAGKAIEQAIRESKWLIIPFDQLDPRLKSIAIDDQNPIWKDFNVEKWKLIGSIEITSNFNLRWRRMHLGFTTKDTDVQIVNRNPEVMTHLLLTGVTALVRGTASYMNAIGPEYPAPNIMSVLQKADILHINNEVPFKEKCNQTEADFQSLRFCSRPKYMDLLTTIGTDIVELDGDHFQDFGNEAILYTFNLYDLTNIPYCGGGRNLEEAQKPLLLENHGNQFAFLGCNGKEIGYAAASATSPGAAHCDMDYLEKEIRRLRTAGYLPIVTFQHIEYYNVKPNQEMMDDFQRASRAGATIVSGSQSHIPMAFEVYPDGIIHYGLGNLFFDQAFFLPETSEAKLDRHTFYNGKLINTEVLTIKFTNLALNRWMTQPERVSVLERILSQSQIATGKENYEQ